ncbi:four helix bundle protein [uncultured Flavobacterium sp.]|uniref:four helix bundle protein n=1 Tax=uncultured Flavobacterium sp. TaxID=165435 RepID=UPI0030CA54BA
MESKYHFKFEDLLVYQKAMQFGEITNSQVKKFPKEERFEFTSQFKRASDSIALNIAEGSGGTDKQFHNYLGNAWHSAHECLSCSSKAFSRNYISKDENELNREFLAELTKMISSLRNIISKRINS